MNKIKLFFINLRASLWFAPGWMIGFSIAPSLVLIEVDSRVKTEYEKEKARSKLVEAKKIFEQ